MAPRSRKGQAAKGRACHARGFGFILKDVGKRRKAFNQIRV